MGFNVTSIGTATSGRMNIILVTYATLYQANIRSSDHKKGERDTHRDRRERQRQREICQVKALAEQVEKDTQIPVTCLLWAGIAQLVERPTEKPGAILTRVRFPGAARDFLPEGCSPRVNFQCRLSYGVRTAPRVQSHASTFR